MNVRRRFLAFAATMIVTAQAAATESPTPWDALEARWNAAHLEGDVDALDSLWADDIRIVVPGMAPMGKDEALGLWRNVPVRFTDYRSSDVAVDARGDTAVVTGRIDRTRQFGERKASEQWQFIKVYGLQDGVWRVLHFVAAPAPNP